MKDWGALGDRENMKMRDKESRNATLQGSTRGGNVTQRERNREMGIEWNGCELEKREHETESRRKRGGEVREGPKFRHGNQREQLPLSPRRYI